MQEPGLSNCLRASAEARSGEENLVDVPVVHDVGGGPARCLAACDAARWRYGAGLRGEDRWRRCGPALGLSGAEGSAVLLPEGQYPWMHDGGLLVSERPAGVRGEECEHSGDQRR